MKSKYILVSEYLQNETLSTGMNIYMFNSKKNFYWILGQYGTSGKVRAGSIPIELEPDKMYVKIKISEKEIEEK